MSSITLFTIGFAKKSAEGFFLSLRNAGVRRIIDIRLNNVSQLAGFTKQRDLEYFLKTICGIGYVHRPDLAPTAELLKAYRSKSIDWPTYEERFKALLRERSVELTLDRSLLDQACFLCSEPDAARCHRRIAAEYLRDALGDIDLCHL